MPRDQGQTLFADGTAAYEALPPALKARVDTLEGLHVGLSAGRGRDKVLAGETPRPLGPHEQPQRQPVARVHPVTGRRALYLCEYGQMDWLEGPFVGMQPGPHGDGAALLGRTDGAPDAPGIRLCPRMDTRATWWCGTIAAWCTPRPGSTPTRRRA